MKTNIMKSLALILSVSLLVLPACSGGGRSKSVEDAGSYDELTADFDDDDEDVEDEDEEDPADDDTSDQGETAEGEKKTHMRSGTGSGKSTKSGAIRM